MGTENIFSTRQLRVPLINRCGTASGCSEVRAAAHLEVWISCVRRGSHPGCLQNTDGYIRDTSESDWSHLCQLPDMATLRGGETLHGLLQHQQREMPAITDTSQKCQGEQVVAAEPRERPLKSKTSRYSCGCSVSPGSLLSVLTASGLITVLLSVLSEQMALSSFMIIGKSWAWIWFSQDSL